MDNLTDLRAFWTAPTLEEAATTKVAPDWTWPWDAAKIAAAFDDIIGPDAIEDVWGATCVDYGCGVGRWAREALRRHAGLVYGVDLSPDMLAHAVKYVDNPRFVPVRADESGPVLPRSLPQIDLAWSFLVAQHCWSWEAVAALLRNMAEGLVPGGHLSVQFQRKCRASEGQCHGFDGVAAPEERVLAELASLGVQATVIEASTLASMPKGGWYDWWFARGRKRA